MSEATALLATGLTELQTQFGQTFTVSGVVGSFTGILEKPLANTALSLAGMVAENSATLHVSRSVSWTPVSGAVVTVGGVAWKVSNVEKELSEWALTLMSPDR